MSDRAFQWSIFTGIPVIVGLVVLAVAFALQQRSDRVEACERVNAGAVATGGGHYLCVTSDGRVVRP